MERFSRWLKPGEDVFNMTNNAQRVRKLLSHWNGQHDYAGPSWAGIIKFHERLAKEVKSAAFESAGWYKYKSSTKKDGMDGKDWRIVLTDFHPMVVVNCHSCINQNVWTLTTTVFNTREIDKNKLKPISDDDPNKRALLWSVEVAKILETHGYKYPDAIKAMKEKLENVA